MIATVRQYWNYSLERGLASEAAIEKALKDMQGMTIMEKRKKSTIRGRIRGFIRSKNNDELDTKHIDFLVFIESDVNGGLLGVPLQTKSSVRGRQIFERKCRLRGWGPIQVVVVDDDDTSSSLLNKVKEALIKGYHAIRRQICEEVHSFREVVLKNRPKFGRRRHTSYEQWCPRFNRNQRCWPA